MGEQIPEKNTGFRRWWSMMRPHTLTASFVPVTLGTALALPSGKLNIPLFIAMLIASMLIQIATNLFNEYFDFKRGLDTAESVGIGGSIVRDGFRPKMILDLALSLCFAAMLIGVYICIESSWWIAAVGSVCILTGYLYSGGPYPIAYTPFGELVSGLFMGVFIIWISFFIQTETLTLSCILISIPIGILVGGINMANNIRDLTGDKKKGRRTLPVLLGRPKAIHLLASLFAFSYLWMIGLMAFRVESAWILIVFASLPKAIQATRLFHGKTKSIQLMPAMKATAQMQTLFGFLLSLGLVLDHFI
ncbi:MULTISPECIES: 1,4-dihydroxy-2-naphthoate polyprenyltransferase [unclassified Sporolactobacillus]|uniref:1,4-dihydroxy-2-naphthoate polyprenyltransferase n=1 Tax=unclassified Sporolactobacillus TaxID=2628533 RepID=UPI0023679156|nr:1,4-dihydroxy-2-naphthoate polyprenyltransferase [Sporolactobacillus sp. CQH2019]MDD9147322.1 1,4-dihydroxy-2-naphthoate polyprenyltransferase [Sporolactobacillus sp. CQH2019]